MDIREAAALYTRQGFLAPFPLPAGEKMPPPAGVTGNIPPVCRDDVVAAWSGVTRANLAVRAQVSVNKDFEIIALDVDDYDDKAGLAGLKALVKRLGPLDLKNIPRSSSRGPNNASGQYFFKVPKNIKWNRQACPDVDIVQLTHRYSVVYPSVVADSATGEQRMYNWYLGREVTEIPHVDSLPELPDRWVQHLTRSHGVEYRQGDSVRLDEAMAWLKTVPGWDAPVSRVLSSYLDHKLPELPGGAHDTMLAVVTYLVKSATEGHTGLEEALQRAEQAFLDEFASRSHSRLGRDGATQEFWSIVCSIVGGVKAEVDSGTREFRPVIEEVDLDSLPPMPNWSALFKEQADK